MALNTPKRIKTLQTFISSPGSDCGVGWRDCTGASDGSGISGSGSSTVHGYGTPMSTSSDANNSHHIVGHTSLTTIGSLSPASSCDSPEFNSRHAHNGSANGMCGSIDARENRRGRPRSEALTTLMIEGSTSPSAIKCSYCNRVFPREKSLQAHLRTHTGERPYLCDYPGCTRAFTQSGQLKTHLRLHTGERPFQCSAPKCLMRFTHANRHCPDHPYDQLKRCDDFVIQSTAAEQNHEVIKWLEKYKMEKEDRTPTRKTPKRATSNSSNSNTNDKSNENYDANACAENALPVTPSNPYKSRKGLMVELDMNAGLGASPLTGAKIKPTPKVIRWHEPPSQEDDSADEFEMPARSTFNPKKRWLREAWQDDLAKPLDTTWNAAPQSHPNENVYDGGATCNNSTASTPLSSINNTATATSLPLNPNQMRPTVLMVASKDRTMPLLNISTTTTTQTAASAAIGFAVDNTQFTNEHETQPNNATSNYHHATADCMPSAVPMVQKQPLTNCYNRQHLQQSQVLHQPSAYNESVTSTLPNSSLDLYTTESMSHERSSITQLNTNPDTIVRANGTDSGRNRKWLGALALMQLATDETNSSTSSPTSSSTSSASSSSSSSPLSSSSASSLSTSPTLSINDDSTKASFTVL